MQASLPGKADVTVCKHGGQQGMMMNDPAGAAAAEL